MTCPPTAKHPRSPRTPWPTAPTSTPSSAPTRPDTVTLIANFIPLQKPDGGPNFYEFGDDVLYQIHVSNDGKPDPDVTYQFRFRTEVRNRKTFLYNTGQITDIADTTWNRPQYYSVTQVKDGKSRVLGEDLPARRSTSASAACPTTPRSPTRPWSSCPGSKRVFAGQRADAFHVDLGSIFDLGALRPFNEAHLISMPEMNGRNAVQSFNVHTIAIRVPIEQLTRDGSRPTNPMAAKSTIGVWATASRRKSRVFDKKTGTYAGVGPWQQVSRLGNPLFNEVVVPMALKDKWNVRTPAGDALYEKYVNKPELAGLLPVLYPGVFPNLAAYTKPRADLHAILLTGIPKGVVPGFQNFTGPTPADMLRLNVAIPPAEEPNNLGPGRGRPGRLSPTAGGSTTTWSPSSCGPSPA